ncbi:MAG: nucleotidyl transferase AbiEii/AbiGii toxin family protein [Micrococcaceae bacterium]
MVEKEPPKPQGIPTEYIMQPYDIKLAYKGRSWCTVKFELGHNEIGDSEEPEYKLSTELSGLFTSVGLEKPNPVPVMKASHQIAQKLHAVSETDSERARDIVDLQLLDKREFLDFSEVSNTCKRLFKYRNQHTWPPTIKIGKQWNTLYEEAAVRS